jgi:hypothetical protein
LLFVDRVNQALAAVFAQHRPDLVALSDDLAPLLGQLETFSSGGKRTRRGPHRCLPRAEH